MMFELYVGLGSLIGFALTNALETAILSLSFNEEKKLLKTIKGSFPKFSSPFGHAFEIWRKHPGTFLMAILMLNAVFSMIWCIYGIQYLGSFVFVPLLVGLILFLLGELFPKVVARRFPAETLFGLLVPFYLTYRLASRLIAPLAESLEKLTPLSISRSFAYPLKEAELKRLIRDSELTRSLRPRSRLVLEALIEFSSKKVRDLMWTAQNLFCLNLEEEDLAHLTRKIIDRPYSRIPVTKNGKLDTLVGVLYTKDLLFSFATSGLVNLEDLLRPCVSVSETMRVADFLDLARREAIHIATVKNKAAETIGMVFLEDVLKSIIGDIHDEWL